jgi:hypothetical protein
MPSPSPTHLCTHCLSQVKPIKVTPGTFLVELFLWLLIIVPGLIYSVWRVTSRYPACPVCKAARPIPIHSPGAVNLLRSMGSAPPPASPSAALRAGQALGAALRRQG